MPPRGLQILVDERGSKLAAARLEQMRRRGDDLRPYFREAQREVGRLEEDWFTTQGHGVWPPLDDATAERKTREGWPATALVATGTLKRSLLASSGRGTRRRIGKTQMRYGTTVYYAVFHRPTRPPLVPMESVRTRRELNKALSKYLLKSMRQSSGLT